MLECWWDLPWAALWLLKGSPQRSTSHQEAGQTRLGAGSENVFGQVVLLPLGRERKGQLWLGLLAGDCSAHTLHAGSSAEHLSVPWGSLCACIH